MQKLLFGTALVGSILSSGVNAAHAEWPEPGDFGEHGDRDRRHVVFGELGLYTTSDETLGVDTSFTVASFLLGGYFRVIEPLEIGVLVPFMYANATFGDESAGQLHSGNHYLQAAYRGDFDSVTLRIGGGFTLPFAQFGDDLDGDDLVAVNGLVASAALRGLWNPWLWIPEQFTLVIPAARADFDVHENVLLAAESSIGIMFSTDDADDETNVIWQLAGEGGGRFGIFEPGLRLQLVVDFNNDGDQAQLSVTPFIRLNFGGGFVDFRLTMNIDDPNGFAFDEGEIWGLRVVGGGRF